MQEALQEILKDELSRAKRARVSHSDATPAPASTTVSFASTSFSDASSLHARPPDDANTSDGGSGGGGDGGDHRRPHPAGIPEAPETFASQPPSAYDETWDDILPPPRTTTKRQGESPSLEQQRQLQRQHLWDVGGHDGGHHIDGDDDDDDEEAAAAGAVVAGGARGGSRRTVTWGEAAVTGALSSVEYEELMCAMHASIEEDLRAEEEALLANELERAEAEDASDLDAALEDFQNWELDTAASAADDPVVLCPVCKARRLLQSSGKRRGCVGRGRVSRHFSPSIHPFFFLFF